MNKDNFFVPVANTKPYFKAAFEGFAGTGKTYTAAKIAVGLHKRIGSTKPVSQFGGMNYHGFILSHTTNEKELYGFLRRALIQQYSDIIPVRGPVNYQDGDWEYSNSAEGELDRFSGGEEIYRAGVSVYKCNYHGGFIK